MRIIAIGLGGAGCRIVDRLYSADHKSSRVACVQPLGIDIDEATLKELLDLPEKNKISFASIDSSLPGSINITDNSATIDIAEIVSRVHNFESGENDAILLCMGLGGSMADVAPHIISGLRSTIREPIFGLVTLPCLAEGEKRSAQAADQIDILSSLLDGMILFDNETWYKKTKALKTPEKPKGKSLVHMLGLAKPEPELSPEHATYFLLNDAIVRRISLILKAGEFKADGGIDLAEVVLDSGEVLNTMKGMGFITIGYAVERLPNNPLAFLSQFRPQGVFDEENKKKASRIVDLAKQAIYHEVSTPCDMTSAHKALVLIAGPSQELSMKGFMTVRKWIDRSIAGLETRSGDYPVVNTKNVAIIIMLSGLENIPRISELREIRAQHHAWADRQRSKGESLSDESSSRGTSANIRDEMIVLPAKMKKGEEPVPLPEPPQSIEAQPRTQDFSPEVQSRIPQKSVISEDVKESARPPLQRQGTKSSHSPDHQDRMMPAPEDSSPRQTKHRVVVSNPEMPSPPEKPVHPKTPPAQGEIPLPVSRQPGNVTGELPKISLPRKTAGPADRDVSRQKIELELQRQRLKAMAGRGKSPETTSPVPIIPTSFSATRKRSGSR